MILKVVVAPETVDVMVLSSPMIRKVEDCTPLIVVVGVPALVEVM